MSQSEIAAVNRMFEEAAGKGDLESLASLYTKDAVALSTGRPVRQGPGQHQADVGVHCSANRVEEREARDGRSRDGRRDGP